MLNITRNSWRAPTCWCRRNGPTCTPMFSYFTMTRNLRTLHWKLSSIWQRPESKSFPAQHTDPTWPRVISSVPGIEEGTSWDAIREWRWAQWRGAHNSQGPHKGRTPSRVRKVVGAMKEVRWGRGPILRQTIKWRLYNSSFRLGFRCSVGNFLIHLYIISS